MTFISTYTDTRRFSGGRSGHYDYYNDNRNDHHRFRRSSGNRGRMHHDLPRHMSRSVSRSSRSVSSSGSYESGEVPKRHAVSHVCVAYIYH